MRKLSFAEAKARYVHRYTSEHVPPWARKPQYDETTGEFIGYYMPHYATDLEWYENTVFPGERDLHDNCGHCESRNQSWPMGKGFSPVPLFDCQKGAIV